MRRSTDERLIKLGGDGAGKFRARPRVRQGISAGERTLAPSNESAGATRCAAGDGAACRATTQCAHGAGLSLRESDGCR